MIHHQFPDIELVSPIYANRFARCDLRPGQNVNAGSVMQTCIKFNPKRNNPIGILMYKLKRKNTDKSNEEATCIQLVMIWRVNKSKSFNAASLLIGHDKFQTWNRHKLMKLTEVVYKPYDIQQCPVEETSLLHNNMVLSTRVNITREEKCCKLEVAIDETSGEGDTLRPPCLDVDG
jgi:hypothetical protein